MKYTFLIIFALVSTILQAKSDTSRDTTEVENENIKYRFTSDTNNLYLNIRTSDRKVMMSMLRSGVLVYFDTKGRKKKNVSVKYPYNSVKPDRDGTNSRTDQKPPEFSEIINDLSNQAEYKYFNNSQKFHIDLNRANINLGFEFFEIERSLEYNLKIPKEHVMTDKDLDISKLSLGVVIGGKNKERQGRKNGQPRQGASGSQKGSRSGGVRGGGRGSGGNRGQGRSSGNSKQQEKRAIKTTEFWFDAVSKK